jgi:hypothetical protein
MLLGQHAERGVLLEGGPLRADERLESRIPGETPVESIERPHLEPKHLIAIDRGLGIKGVTCLHETLQGGQLPGAVHFLDCEIERIQVASRRRRVGTGLLGHDRRGGVQRVQQQQPATLFV